MKSEDILKRTQDLLGAKASEKEAMKTQLENERRLLITSLAEDISSIIQPTLENMIQANQVTIDSLRQAMREIRVEVPKTEVRMPTINVPRPQVNVSVPEMKMPTVNVPPPVVNFPERMSVSMDSVNNKAPLPVMMMDSFGKPMTFSMGAGGGGKADFFTIKDIKTSLGASLINDEGNLKIAGSFSVTASNSSTQAIDSSGEVYSRANPLPVYDMSGASGSVASALIDSSGVQYSGTNPLPVVFSATGTTASAIVDSSGVQYSGSNPLTIGGTVAVSGITNSVGATILNGEGVARDTWGSSQVGTWNIGTVASITATTAVANIDSSGVQYSGSNPFPMTIVTSSVVSTIAVGSVVGDAVDDGSAPVQSGGVARTANPTAVSGGDVVKSSFDDLGRQVMKVNQVRDLLQTAYASLTNGTETTLLSGTAGFFYDLVYLMGANSSDVSVTVDIRPVTAGNVVMTLQIPASGTAGISLPVPLPQSGSDTGNNWTADMGDITGTTVYLSGLFSKEV